VLFVAAPALVRPLAAQQRYRVTQEENFRRDPAPDAVRLATVTEGVELTGTAGQSGWVEVTLAGWMWGASLAPTSREGHNRVVSASGGENLRSEPNGPVLARLANGCLLTEVDSRPGWIQVRRTGWMWAASLERIDTAAAGTRGGRASAAPPPRNRAPTAGVGLDRAVTSRAAPLHRAPDGDSTGVLAADAPVRILARSGDWVRIQTEGWVRESDLKPSDADVLVGVSAAEVRSRPAEFEGQLVQWTLQFIAVQSADELRQEMPPGRQYMLARGPLPEAGFVYVLLNEAQVAEIERLPPLAELVIIGQVRVGRSRYLGNPILELVDLAVRQP
jgi:hypothetical protein